MKYDKDWYDKLAKPPFQPPAWVFAPVWTVLYFLMAVAFFIVLLTPFRILHLFAYLFFVLQMIVNLSWSPVFFEEHNLRKAFLLSAFLFLLVFITCALFFIISKIAGIILLPYLFWCFFATVLSFEILERNEP